MMREGEIDHSSKDKVLVVLFFFFQAEDGIRDSDM